LRKPVAAIVSIAIALTLLAACGCALNPCAVTDVDDPDDPIDPNEPDTTDQDGILNVPGEYATIEEALGVSIEGDTIRIACGTFYEHGLVLQPGVVVEGEDRETPCVVIDAQQQGRIFRVPAECGPDTEVVGLILRNGLGTDGGAMYLYPDSAPRLTNLKFLDNSVSDPNGEGGAIMCVRSSPTLTNVTFSGNSAGYGGAMWCYLQSTPVLVDCEFTGNSATGRAHAGALGSYDSSVQATRCLFSDNVATDGGAVKCRVVSGNPRAVFEDCVFSRNTGVYGGGLFGANVDLISCGFYENESYIGGGVQGYGVLVEDCILRGNVADLGGAFGMVDFEVRGGRAESTLRGCTLYGNSADSGGGAYVYGLHLNLVNTMIVGSRSGEAVKADAYQTSASLSCCNLFGNAGGDWVAGIEEQLGVDGNISLDPLFCDVGVDFSISALSPCADENSGICGLIGAVAVGCE
jgi:hypothetical protein